MGGSLPCTFSVALIPDSAQPTKFLCGYGQQCEQNVVIVVDGVDTMPGEFVL